MSTQAERLVRIESPNGRRRYAMSEAAFKHAKQTQLGDETYEGAGYKIVSYEDGTEYGEGKEPTKYGIHATALSPEIGAVEEEKPAKATTATSASMSVSSMSGSARRAATETMATDDAASSPAESAQSE